MNKMSISILALFFSITTHDSHSLENSFSSTQSRSALTSIYCKSLETIVDLSQNIFQFAKQNPVSAVAIATATVLLARYIYVDTYNLLFPAKEMWFTSKIPGYSGSLHTKLHEKPFIPEWIKKDTSWDNVTDEILIYKRK